MNKATTANKTLTGTLAFVAWLLFLGLSVLLFFGVRRDLGVLLALVSSDEFQWRNYYVWSMFGLGAIMVGLTVGVGEWLYLGWQKGDVRRRVIRSLVPMAIVVAVAYLVWFFPFT